MYDFNYADGLGFFDEEDTRQWWEYMEEHRKWERKRGQACTTK